MINFRPVSDLRNHFSDVKKEVNASGNPTVFTTNGKAAMVAMSFDKFSQMAHLDYVERALREADTYAKKNPGNLTHEDVFSRIKAKING